MAVMYFLTWVREIIDHSLSIRLLLICLYTLQIYSALCTRAGDTEREGDGKRERERETEGRRGEE